MAALYTTIQTQKVNKWRVKYLTGARDLFTVCVLNGD